MKAIEITVYGRVQGVFFRASTRDEATRLGIKGWCMNQADGTVFIHAEGSENILTSFTDWCKKGPMMAKVSELVSKEAEIEGFTSFEVRR